MDNQNSSDSAPHSVGVPEEDLLDSFAHKTLPWFRRWHSALAVTLLVFCVLPVARIRLGAAQLQGLIGSFSYSGTPPATPPDGGSDPDDPCPSCGGGGSDPSGGGLAAPAVATGRASGPSSPDPVNLATGVEKYAPPADLTVYNPNGPQVSFQRAYFSDRAKMGLASPGLSAGWAENYDITVQGPQLSGTWGAVTLTYPNGSQENLTPQLDGSGQPTGALSPPAGRPFLAQGQPGSTAGEWDSLTVTWKDQTQWVFTPFAGGGYVLSRITDRMGHSIDLAWNAGRSLTAVTDAASNAVLLSLSYDGSGNLAAVADAYGRQVTYGFGAATGVTGPVLLSVSQIGGTGAAPAPHYTYGYAAFYGQPLLSTLTVPSPAGSGTSTSTIHYDASGRVSSLVDANGNQRVYAIGTSGTTVQVKDSAGAVVAAWTRNFDGSNRATGTTDASGHSDSITYGGTPYKPDSVSDANGNTTAYTYDGYGNVTSITSPRGTVTAYTYDYSHFALGRLVQVQEDGKAPTTYTYFEPSGLVKTITQPMPGVNTGGVTVTTAYTYDSLGNVLTLTRAGNGAAASLTTTYNYTQDGGYSQPAALAQPLTVTSPGGKVTHLRYDAQGRPVSALDALGLETELAYNVAGQATQTTLPATGQNGSGQATRVTAYLYPGGPPTSTTAYDESGATLRQVSYDYGLEGELLSVSGSTEPVSYAYDALYRVTALADGKGQDTLYAYNGDGEVAQITYPGGDTTQYPSYDGDGNALQRVDGRGVVTNYAYSDPERRLTDIQYPATPGLNVHFTYDAYGRRATMTDGAGGQTYAYDDDNLLVSVTTAYTGLPAQTVSYTYNPDGSRESMITPAGAFAYGYDADGHLTGLTNPAGEASAWTYLDNGWLKTQTLGNGAVTTYTRDAQGRLLDLVSKTAGGAALSDFGGMSYDGVGNRLAVTVAVPSAPSAFSGQTAYAYDAKDQLLQEQSTRNGGYTNAFAYDAAGNPTTSRGVSGNTFNPDNQITNGGFAYDGAGNPTTYQGVGLAFDPENRLTQYGSALTAGYNGDNLRGWKQGSGGRTYFLYDGIQPVVELDSSGSVTAVNTFGAQGLVSRRTGGVSTFYTFDASGNVAQRLGTVGNVISSNLYDAFGQRQSTGGADAFGYGAQWGYYTDTETGLVLCVHRYYDPGTGRWLTRDPMGYDGGINLYGYVRNNAANLADPSGYCPINLAPILPPGGVFKDPTKNDPTGSAPHLPTQPTGGPSYPIFGGSGSINTGISSGGPVVGIQGGSGGVGAGGTYGPPYGPGGFKWGVGAGGTKSWGPVILSGGGGIVGNGNGPQGYGGGVGIIFHF